MEEKKQEKMQEKAKGKTQEKKLPYTRETAGVKSFAHSPDFDGVVVRRFMRWSSIPLARLLAPTGITPNMVTVFGFLVSVLALYFFTLGRYPFTVAGGILALFAFYLDYVDGSLARIKKMGNIYGQFLDMYFGRFGVLVIFLGVIIGVYKQHPSPYVWLAGFLAYTAALMNGALYNSFHRLVPEKAKEVIASEKKRQWLLPNFYYVEVFYYPLICIMALFDALYWFLFFAAVYGWLFTLGTFYIFGRAIKKEAKIKSEERSA